MKKLHRNVTPRDRQAGALACTVRTLRRAGIAAAGKRRTSFPPGMATPGARKTMTGSVRSFSGVKPLQRLRTPISARKAQSGPDWSSSAF
jgi:hypothetical protein